MVCNPPFGTKIVEKRKEVLKLFDLGHQNDYSSGTYKIHDQILESQETGILFAEVCVKQAKPNGRIAIILPNGYLGNRSNRYRAFREWLIRTTKIVGIVSFPRFTFKSSGADVSASVIFLEKKEKVDNLKKDKYSFFVEMVEKVGWDAGNKKGEPIFIRNEADGALIINDEGEPIVDSDFSMILERIANSKSVEHFPWLSEGKNINKKMKGWTVDISEVLKDVDLTLDPKRYCEKVTQLKTVLKEGENITLGEVVDFLEEKKSSDGKPIKLEKGKVYSYIELQDISYGEYYSTELRGWQLPSRAKHLAEEGDIYFGSIWGSVAKWCYIGTSKESLIVTNGCHRCRIKKDMEEHLLDLLVYMNTEGWATQLRAMARGSDGLAEVTVDDAKKVIIPILSKDEREIFHPFIKNLKEGRITFNRTVELSIKNKTLEVAEVAPRYSHIVLV